MSNVILEKVFCQKNTWEDLSVLLEGSDSVQEDLLCIIDFLCNEVNLLVGQIKRREKNSVGIFSSGLSKNLQDFHEQVGKILETGIVMSD